MQDSGDAEAKLGGSSPEAWQRFGWQAGLSLFCALLQFRLIMFILGPGNYQRSVEAALGVVTGHPHWRIAQSRVLGPWLVQALTPLLGSYLWAHVAFSLIALAVAGVLAWRIGGLRGFLALQFSFTALLSAPWLYVWDYLDLVVFLVFVQFIKDRRPWPWLVALYAVAILNRDSAQFIALWLVIEGALRRQWRPMITGAALIPVGVVLLEFLRKALLVQEMGPKLFLDTPYNPANAMFGWQLGHNLAWLGHSFVPPDLSLRFLVPLLLVGSFAACVLLIRRGAIALGLTFAAMTAAVPLFAILSETRTMICLIPALVALCHTETGPPCA